MIQARLNGLFNSSKVEMELPSTNMFANLPVEITLNIFSCLAQSDLARCAAVSREWYIISSDPTLWHHLELSNLRHTSLPSHALPPSLARRLGVCRSLTLDSTTHINPTDILRLLYHASYSPNLHSLTLTSLTNFRSVSSHLGHFFLTTKSRCLTHVDLSGTAIDTPVVQALMKTHRSTLLVLKLAFTEIGDGALRAVAAGERLRSISLAGCFGLSRGALRAWMGRRVPWSVRRVDLRWLVDVRVGWVADLLARNARQGGGKGSLETVDVSGCERLTLKEVQSLEERWRGVEVTNSAVLLVEGGIWGYRLTEHPTMPQPLSTIGDVAGITTVSSSQRVANVC
ncbi:hypothetical protein Q9L58_002577 [Maublancomyces gigas]|uniref:F-box domain-containing protein n=1 Tax=Discina gigas TaxID=1032678 RepID=A0ABR3GRC7_9PEZI